MSLCQAGELTGEFDDVKAAVALFFGYSQSRAEFFSALCLFTQFDVQHEGVGPVVVPADIAHIQVSDFFCSEGTHSADGNDQDITEVSKLCDCQWSHQNCLDVCLLHFELWGGGQAEVVF